LRLAGALAGFEILSSGVPERLCLEEDEDDKSVPNKVDNPEEEEENSKYMRNKRMAGRELCPVLANHWHYLLWDIKQLVGSYKHFYFIFFQF